jgi:predicted transcriptional regulator
MSNIAQIREQLEMLESNYSMALDFSAYNLANALSKQIDELNDKLAQLIRAEDPYTTEADIRYFESVQQSA